MERSKIEIICEGKFLWGYYSQFIPRVGEYIEFDVDGLIREYKIKKITHIIDESYIEIEVNLYK